VRSLHGAAQARRQAQGRLRAPRRGRPRREPRGARSARELGFRLLSDQRLENARRFQSYDEFEELELHSTILLDAQGRVRWARHGGPPFTDVDFLLGELERMGKTATP
jgi:peroxiredoxin